MRTKTSLSIVILAIMLVSLANSALAADMTLNWINPTTYTDGTAMPLSDIASLRIAYGKCPTGSVLPSDATVITVNKVGTTLATTKTITGLTAATRYCAGMATMSVSRGDSALSAIISNSTNALAPPSPPSGVTFEPQVVYMEVRGQNRFALVAVGTVPAGVQCDMTQSLNGYNVVPTSAVTWSGTVRPPVVVSKCS